jgi:hypothetical protein
MKSFKESQVRWFTPVILTARVAEIRRIVVQSQPGHKSMRSPSQSIKR